MASLQPMREFIGRIANPCGFAPPLQSSDGTGRGLLKQIEYELDSGKHWFIIVLSLEKFSVPS